MPVSEYRECYWGIVPSDALVISSAKSSDDRRRLQEFLMKAIEFYSFKTKTNSTTDINSNNNPNNRFDSGRAYDSRSGGLNRFSTSTDRNMYNTYNTYDKKEENTYNSTQLYEKFDIFESARYNGKPNLMFEDSTYNLVAIKEDDQSFKNYLGNKYIICTFNKFKVN